MALVMKRYEIFWSWNQKNLDLGRYKGNGEEFLSSVFITTFSISLISETY